MAILLSRKISKLTTSYKRPNCLYRVSISRPA